MNLSNTLLFNPIDFLGVMAGSMGLIGVGTQVVKSWLSKSTRALSLLALVVSAMSAVLWLIYGFLQADQVLMLSNIIGATLWILLLIFKLCFG